MKVVGFGLNEGSGFWRMMIPLGELNAHGHKGYVSTNAINDEELWNADTVILKNVVDMMGMASCQAMRETNKLKIVIDVDDDLFVGKDHPYKKKHDAIDSTFIFTQTIKIADTITTTTEYLAEKLRKLNKNVFVCPNCYDPIWFKVKQRTHDGPLRIGWLGGATHEGDLKMVAPVLKRLREKYPVQIVTRGDYRVKEWWGQDVEVFPTVPIKYYPEALASMAIDIGICPLEENEFNKCKSPIKAMEFSLLGIPAVCSPTVYSNLSILTIARTQKDWFKELSNLIEKLSLRKYRGTAAKGFFEDNYNIKYNWKLWEKALQ
jgi:hypothetical protein